MDIIFSLVGLVIAMFITFGVLNMLEARGESNTRKECKIVELETRIRQLEKKEGK